MRKMVGPFLLLLCLIATPAAAQTSFSFPSRDYRLRKPTTLTASASPFFMPRTRASGDSTSESRPSVKPNANPGSA